MRHVVKIAVLLFTSPCFAAPVLTFEAGRVNITGLNPGASVALFGVQQERDIDHLKTRTFEASLTDADGDGVITFEAEVHPQSIWAVAEIATGAVITASPGDYALETVPGSALRSPESISLSGDLMEVLYFRPAVGAWRQTVVDSGIKDADHEPDGKATISFEQLTALGDAPPSPGRYAPGDTLVAINPLNLHGYILGAGK